MSQGIRLLMLTLIVVFTIVWEGTRPSYAEYSQALTVAAANSLKDALRAILPIFEKEQGNVEVRVVGDHHKHCATKFSRARRSTFSPFLARRDRRARTKRTDPAGQQARLCGDRAGAHYASGASDQSFFASRTWRVPRHDGLHWAIQRPHPWESLPRKR